eukprot:COSAG01_NODE_7246_length_3284_cov_8.194035_2_plen_105_part_00
MGGSAVKRPRYAAPIEGVQVPEEQDEVDMVSQVDDLGRAEDVDIEENRMWLDYRLGSNGFPLPAIEQPLLFHPNIKGMKHEADIAIANAATYAALASSVNGLYK